MKYFVVIVCLGAFLLSACSSQSADTKQRIDIFVAASLTQVAEEAAAALKATYPDYDFEINSGGSQLLEAQIRKGADAEVFLSADILRTTGLVKDGVAKQSAELCGNRLVLVVPETSSLQNPSDIAKAGVRIVLAAKEVPVGKLTFAALAALGIEAAAQENIISEETNVSQVVLKLTQGEADAGFVYATNLAKMNGFRELPLGAGAQVSRYGIAKITESKLSNLFYAYMLGAEGQAILESHGFSK